MKRANGRALCKFTGSYSRHSLSYSFSRFSVSHPLFAPSWRSLWEQERTGAREARERRARSFLHRLRWLLPCIARAWLLARSPNGEPLAGLTIWWNNPFNIKTFLFIFGSWIFAHVSGEEKDTKKKKCYVEIDVMFITWVRRKENFLTCTCIIIF